MTYRQDNPDYLARKRRYDDMITLYGRKTVLEILQNDQVEIHRLHLAESNRQQGILEEITGLAERRGIEIRRHTRRELSRISRNARQDQGVAIDLISPGFLSLDSLPRSNLPEGFELILLDGVTNPQNLGMIIRSVAASPASGIVIPEKGCASIDPLVYKASAGTLLGASIYHCRDITSAMASLKRREVRIVGLDPRGAGSFTTLDSLHPRVFVLGNESRGLSDEVRACCDELVSIPMANGVESLNVSAAATLVAFRRLLNA